LTALKPYPEYADSGSDWLGEVPISWPIKRAKAVLRERKVPSTPNDVHLTPSQIHGVLPQSEYMERTGNKVVLNLTGADMMRHVEPNDFISHLRSFQGGFEHSTLAGKVSAAYTVLEPREGVVPAFFRYLFKSSRYVQALQTTTDQLRDGQSIRFAQVVLLPLPLPSPEVQQGVADFLDRETAEIDAFIADQEELIGLLVERRAATISHAVTKGLDPNVPMKDSGVEWLGEVPAAWDVLRIKHVGYSIIGLTYSPDDIVDEPDNSTIVLRSGNVQNGRIDISSDVVRVLMPIDAALRTREGDIVICARNGSRALVGKNALIEKQLVGQTFGAFMSVLRTPDYRFVQWILNSSLFASQMGLFSTSTVNQLTKATLDNFEIPWPDSDARLRLAIHLDRETAEIDAAIADAGEAIALSRERRAALISAAVTGKIDVREHGAVA
jgi:type I restriction enzyme S subunit